MTGYIAAKLITIQKTIVIEPMLTSAVTVVTSLKVYLAFEAVRVEIFAHGPQPGEDIIKLFFCGNDDEPK
jgi:hypothetical protein